MSPAPVVERETSHRETVEVVPSSLQQTGEDLFCPTAIPLDAGFIPNLPLAARNPCWNFVRRLQELSDELDAKNDGIGKEL